MIADELSQNDIDALLNAAESGEFSSADSGDVDDILGGFGGGGEAAGQASNDNAPQLLEMPNFELSASEVQENNIDILMDVDIEVKIELGRTNMFVEDILRLGPGSVVELDKRSGDPVDILVNDRIVGRGEVLVLNDVFCVRVTEILSPKERFQMQHI